MDMHNTTTSRRPASTVTPLLDLVTHPRTGAQSVALARRVFPNGRVRITTEHFVLDVRGTDRIETTR